MDKNKIIILINKAIDNELTAEEQKALNEELKANAEAAKLYNELRDVARILGEDNSERFELDVTDEVLNKIDRNKYIRRKNTSLSILEIFRQRRLVISYSLGLVTGILLISVLLVTGLLNSPNEGISGTMAENYSDFQTTDEILINNDDISGTISSQVRADMVIATVKLSSKEKYKVDFSFNEQNISLYSIKAVTLSNESNFSSGRNFVNINNKGDNRFLILFRNNINHEDMKIKLTSETGRGDEYVLSTKD